MPAATHTFLFADLVGFTALAELEGDERALEVVMGLQRRAFTLLDEHSAEHVKTIGDGLMLRCENATSAVRLGVALVEQLAAEEGFPPIRIGIHTGSALARDGDWFGTTVNVAARLCAVAPGGEVLASETTRAAAEPLAAVCWGERELHWLRGISQPVASYSVTPGSAPDARGPVGRLTASRRGLAQALHVLCPPIHGREATT